MAVYFLQISEDVIKIGKAKDVKRRIRTLQTAHPYRLELLAVDYVSEDRLEEKRLHKLFRRLRIRGDHFRAAPELVDYIANLVREQNIRLSKLVERPPSRPLNLRRVNRPST